MDEKWKSRAVRVRADAGTRLCFLGGEVLAKPSLNFARSESCSGSLRTSLC